MTTDNLDSCRLDPSTSLSDYGWRYCHRTPSPALPNPRHLTSPPWDFHESLGEYFTNAALAPGVSGHPNDTISNKGSQITFSVPPYQRSNRLIPNDFLGILNIGSGGVLEFKPELISVRVRDALNHQPRLQAGDYMWIDSTPGDNHGLLVVGWGLTQTCPSALTNTGSLFTSYTDALNAPNDVIPEVNGVAQAVPYVADFLGYAPNNLQSPVPRPFYCTGYNEPGKQNFSGHDWYFYTLPDAITQSTTSIYVDPDWIWTSID